MNEKKFFSKVPKEKKAFLEQEIGDWRFFNL